MFHCEKCGADIRYVTAHVCQLHHSVFVPGNFGTSIDRLREELERLKGENAMLAERLFRGPTSRENLLAGNAHLREENAQLRERVRELEDIIRKMVGNTSDAYELLATKPGDSDET